MGVEGSLRGRRVAGEFAEKIECRHVPLELPCRRRRHGARPWAALETRDLMDSTTPAKPR